MQATVTRCKHWLDERFCSLCRAPELAARDTRVRKEAQRKRRISRKAEEILKHSGRFDFSAETLYFLHERGRVDASMPRRAEGEFLELYERITGEQPHGYLVTEDRGPQGQWGLGLRISFPRNERALAELETSYHVYTNDDITYSISNNQLVWSLIVAGFRLGRQERE